MAANVLSSDSPLLPPPLPKKKKKTAGSSGSSAASSDALSDGATRALIRRTLCPPPSGDKGRAAQALPLDQLLPPLTSRNDVDMELYALLAIVLREFVQGWYGKLTTDETLVAETVHTVAHCTRTLEQRLRNVDLENLAFNEIPEVLEKHLTTYQMSHRPSMQSPPPPLAVDARDAYHALWPLPLLSPVPRPDDERATDQQAENEAAYRQLLVEAVLAVLLPTEELENPCLTALVGQILSELVIGNSIRTKAAQPWLLYEGICIAARAVEAKRPAAAAQGSGLAPTHAAAANPATSPWSVRGFVLATIQLGVVFLSAVRWLAATVALSSSLPPRSSTTTTDDVSASAAADDGTAAPTKVPVPILESRLWRCLGSCIGLRSRMPWLGGCLSLLQFGAVHGPGRIAGVDSRIDRLLSHYLQSLLFSPTHLPPILRTLRGVLFPYNAPGSSSLRPPSSDAELRALRRRAAGALCSLLPLGVARVYFGARLTRRRDAVDADDEHVLDQVEELLMVLSDEYCNKHLMYSLLELLLVRLMPELTVKGVVELWDERLGR